MCNSKQKIPVCSHCGSADVKADAYATWSRVNQRWEVENVFDKGAVCEPCGGETSIEWIKPK